MALRILTTSQCVKLIYALRTTMHNRTLLVKGSTKYHPTTINNPRSQKVKKSARGAESAHSTIGIYHPKSGTRSDWVARVLDRADIVARPAAYASALIDKRVEEALAICLKGDTPDGADRGARLTSRALALLVNNYHIVLVVINQ